MATAQETLEKYHGLYLHYQKGGRIALTHPEKMELAQVRRELFYSGTNIHCDPCVAEMLRILFTWYEKQLQHKVTELIAINVEPVVIENPKGEQYVSSFKEDLQALASSFKKIFKIN